jgi:hypothetical protein
MAGLWRGLKHKLQWMKKGEAPSYALYTMRASALLTYGGEGGWWRAGDGGAIRSTLGDGVGNFHWSSGGGGDDWWSSSKQQLGIGGLGLASQRRKPAWQWRLVFVASKGLLRRGLYRG